MNPDSVFGQIPDIADGVNESNKALTTKVRTRTSRKKTIKTNAQKCREYRERKKLLQNTMVQNITADRSNECSETDPLKAKKRPKTNAERRKKHYEAQKLKKQAIKKIPKSVKQRNKEYYERKKKKLQALKNLNHHSDASCDNCSQKICKHPKEICNNAEETQQNNSFHVPYQQFRNCAQPQGIYYQDVNIPSDGNCFFFSIIKIMNLSMSPLQIRQQLLSSPFVNTCINPNGARSILSSETEYAEMDCIEIFAKVYNQNVCVHNYYVNTRTNLEEIQFLHFRVNDLQSFIHLHLRDVHFTPLIQVEELNINNIAENQHTEKISSRIFSDDEVSGVDNDEHDADIATFNVGMNDINDTVPKYEDIQGQLQFYNILKKKTFGQSCAVCDKLWVKDDLKSTTGLHDDILQLVLLYNKVGYPVSMCYICLSVLRTCERFMETARDSNRILKQWHTPQTEMTAAEPPVTYPMTKVKLENEDISSENDIKTENVDLAKPLVVDIKTEYTEYNIDVDTVTVKKEADDQTDNSTDSTYNDTTEVNDDKKTVPLFHNEINNEWSRLDMISQHNNDDSQIRQDIEIIEVKPEIETYDEIQLSSGIEVPIEFNTDVNIQELHESVQQPATTKLNTTMKLSKKIKTFM